MSAENVTEPEAAAIAVPGDAVSDGETVLESDAGIAVIADEPAAAEAAEPADSETADAEASEPAASEPAASEPETADAEATEPEAEPIRYESDPVLAVAVDQARDALLEVIAAEQVGRHVGHRVDGEFALSLLFENKMRGYPGWYWSVTMGRVDGDAEPQVLEIALMPNPDEALLSPAWVPWSDRLAEYRAAQVAAALEAAEAAEHDDDDDEDDEDDDDNDGVREVHGGDIDGVDVDVAFDHEHVDDDFEDEGADDDSDDDDDHDDDDDEDDDDDHDDDHDDDDESEEDDESDDEDSAPVAPARSRGRGNQRGRGRGRSRRR